MSSVKRRASSSCRAFSSTAVQRARKALSVAAERRIRSTALVSKYSRGRAVTQAPDDTAPAASAGVNRKVRRFMERPAYHPGAGSEPDLERHLVLPRRVGLG